MGAFDATIYVKLNLELFMRHIVSFFLIICMICVLFIGCEDNNSDVETTTAADTTTVSPETTVIPITTVPITTVPITTVPVTTVPVTTAPVTTAPVTAEPGVVTAPAGDGWSDFH